MPAGCSSCTDTGEIEHRHFRDLGDYLQPGDILVANDSRVIPARLYGFKSDTGGRGDTAAGAAGRAALARPGRRKRLREGTRPHLPAGRRRAGRAAGHRHGGPGRRPARADLRRSLEAHLDALGHTPLPPYIHEPLDDPERYQTIYARPAGPLPRRPPACTLPASCCCPCERGVRFETLTLHVGLDTFKPVEAGAGRRAHHPQRVGHPLPDAARRINEAKLAGGRLVAVVRRRPASWRAPPSARPASRARCRRSAPAMREGETWDICP